MQCGHRWDMKGKNKNKIFQFEVQEEETKKKIEKESATDVKYAYISFNVQQLCRVIDN